jgi:hypothetical protein
MENKESLLLFCALSSHALTRTAAGWAYERSMHERLGMGGADLSNLSRPYRGAHAAIHSSPPWQIGWPQDANLKDSFYWIPSVANFPGVDGVLGDTDGHVYLSYSDNNCEYPHKS